LQSDQYRLAFAADAERRLREDAPIMMKSVKKKLRAAAATIEMLERRTLLTGVMPSFTSAAAGTADVQESFSFLITTNGSPAPKISESGGLPAGLKFTDNGDGTATIAGIPTKAGNGVFKLKFSARSSAGAATQSFTLDVDEIPKINLHSPTPVFNTVAGGSYTFKTSEYGAAIPTLSVADLPTGVTFTDNHDGTGTLTVPAGSVVTPAFYATSNDDALMVSASNPAGGVIDSLALTIDDTPDFTSADNETINIDQASLFDVTTTGFPISRLTLGGSLPKGLTFAQTRNGTNGYSGAATISGTPLESGTFHVTLIANNRLLGLVKQDFTITVNEITGFTTLPQTTFTVGKAGKYIIKTHGFPPSAMTEAGALPPGVTFKDNGNNTATLAGIPDAGTEGVYHFTVFADGGLASQFFTLTVN
jgi:hypothetical protein